MVDAMRHHPGMGLLLLADGTMALSHQVNGRGSIPTGVYSFILTSGASPHQEIHEFPV